MSNETFLGFNFFMGLVLTICAWVLCYNLGGTAIPDVIKMLAAVLAGGRTMLTIATLIAWICQVSE